MDTVSSYEDEQEKNIQYYRCGGISEDATLPNPVLTPVASAPATSSSAIVLGHNLETKKDITLSDTERTSGTYVIGGTGVGKTTLLTGVFLGDIANGRGGLFIDIDGDSINELLPRIPKERMQDVILLDPGADGRYFGINPLAGVKSSRDTDRVIQIFKRLWNIGPETPNLENTLRACLLTLWHNKKTIAEMPYLLRDKEFRDACIANIPSSVSGEWVCWYWEQDFGTWYKHIQLERSDSTLNKILQLLMIENTTYVVSQSITTLDLRTLMDENKIILLRLSLKDIGEDAVRFLGTLLMAELKHALLSRADVEGSKRSFFSLCADEWQLYLSPDFKDILTRGRKYGIGATLANQTLTQLDEELQSITQQVNIHVTFRVGSEDTRLLAPYYAKDPPPSEPRLEYVRTPSSEVVDFICSGRSHTYPIVNKVLGAWRNYVQWANEHIREYWKEENARYGVDTLNDLLLDVMRTRNPRVIFPLDLLEWIARQFTLPFFDFTRFDWWLRRTDEELETWPLYHPPRDYVFSLLTSERNDVTVTLSAALVQAYNRLWEVEEHDLPSAFSVYEGLARTDIRNTLMNAFRRCIKWLQTQKKDECPTNDDLGYTTEELSFLQPTLLSAKSSVTNLLAALRNHELDWLPRIDHKTLVWEKCMSEEESLGLFARYRLQAGEEAKFILEPFISQEIDRISETCKPSFEEFVRNYRAVMYALAADPVVESSGAIEEKPGIQRTVQDMVNEMAQELVNLPNKTAYLAIGSRGGRYKPRMKTIPLKYVKEDAWESLLKEHREQALDNARQYTTEASQIEQEIQDRRRRKNITPSIPVERQEVVSAPARIAKRRVATFTPIQISTAPKPREYKLADSDILYGLYQFRHLTNKQLAWALQRKSSANRVQEIVNGRLVSQGLVAVTSPSGRAAYIYSLTKKGKRALEADKGTLPDVSDTGYSAHLHNVNNLLIPSLLLPYVEPRIGLLDWQHGEAFKVRPVSLGNNRAVVPDGFVSYVLSPPFGKDGEPVGIIFEWDEGTESLAQLRDKFLRYITFASGIYQDTFHLNSLTIAFCASEKDRILRMKTLAEEVTKDRKAYAELFLFSDVNTGETDPLTLCTTPLFHQPFDTNLHALIEPGA